VAQKISRPVKDMCERCDLAPSTIERYQKGWMLRSDVVACLLLSFVWAAEDTVEGLLNDKGCVTSGGYLQSQVELVFVELGDVLQRLAGKKFVLELTGNRCATTSQDGLSLLELQARNLLLESGLAML
jgi:hypothetical protein